MAITIGSRLDAAFISGTSFTTPSKTWVSGSLYLLAIVEFAAGAPAVPTSIAGATMTFSRVTGCDLGGITLNGTNARVGLWAALGNGNTETVTGNLAQSDSDGFYEIDSFSLTSGSWSTALSAIKQSATPTKATSANPSLSLAALQDAASVAFGFSATAPNSSYTAGLSTSFGGFGHGTPVSFTTNGEAQVNVTTVNWTLASADWASLAVEIAAPAAAPATHYGPFAGKLPMVADIVSEWAATPTPYRVLKRRRP